MTVNGRIAKWFDDRKNKDPKSVLRQTNMLYTIELWEMPSPPPEVLIRVDREVNRKIHRPHNIVLTATARPAIRKGRWTVSWCEHSEDRVPEYVKAHVRRLLRERINTEDFIRRSWGRGYIPGARRAN